MSADELGALEELAAARGLETRYVDGLGTRRVAEPEVLLEVLRSLGDLEELASPADARAVLRRWRAEHLDQMLEPVYVVDEGVDAVVHLHLGRRSPRLECRVEFEHGGELSWTVDADGLVPSAHPEDRAAEGPVVGLPLPALRVGYHHLVVTAGRRTARSTLLARPLQGRHGRFSSDWRAFSVQAPIFSLHSSRSWGAGDVSDLEEFARLAGASHASVVSTLPLLAAFGPSDFEPSPYRPVSRRFWSDRWISLDWIEGLDGSSAAHRLLTEVHPPAKRASWVRDGVVDGKAAFAAKREVVQAWAASQSDFMEGERGGLYSFIMDHPDVNDYARFRSAGERFGLDFRRWPSTARSGLLRWNDFDPTVVRYHLFAQWLIDRQLDELASGLAQRGQTLGLDLPIGVHPSGYDVWKHPEQYVTSMSIGAPPDPLAPQGQVWGSPPPHPDRSRDAAHRQLRQALAFHMRVAGVVRIDHILGLRRLFWVPEGASAEVGVYMSMPFKELLAVVAIEAQRHRVEVVGEDLGTVEEGLRDEMAREGLRRTYVAQYALDVERGELEEPPAGSLASFSTHDTPTFLGWWRGTDLDERASLGLLDADEAAVARSRRDAERQALRDALGLGDEGPEQVLAAIHARLADSDAALVMVELADLLGEEVAVNVPGTSHERPNWALLAGRSLEELGATTALSETLAPLSERRGFSSASPWGPPAPPRPEVSRFSPDDLHLFNEGRHFRLYDHLGCHPMTVDGVAGCYFAIWAPNADKVAVVGEFNSWDESRDPLRPRGSSGVWEVFVPGVSEGATYKYRLRSRLGGDTFDKADPFGRACELPPATASRTWRSSYEWADDGWLARRRASTPLAEPMAIYEVHLPSWRRVPEEANRSLSYREIAPLLADHVVEMGFTHVELLPVMEHPYYGSWGYQTTGYFAPTARLGSPDDFKYLVDHLHQRGIGVLLDWVPSHFPADAFALGLFDGTHLYEHAEERKRVHPDWLSWTFNYGRNEVRCFLISSAFFWLDEYHVDGLRLDAVASMLHLDYSRQPGEWVPNRHGGNIDLEAVDFLRQCTTEVTSAFPGATVIAEESTAFPGVTGEVDHGGLGFTLKWDMGWMHDTLAYLGRDPIHRSHHQGEITFRAIYAGNEHFVLPLSHDEVVHGKGSLVAKMAGDDWQRRANLRLLFGYQYTIPGKKMLFMGDEFAQVSEWDHETSLDWHLLAFEDHRGIAAWVRDLNELYRAKPALHRDERRIEGFDWVSCDDAENSVLIWRRSLERSELMVAANFTPVPRSGYVVAISAPGTFSVLANSDDPTYGGSGAVLERTYESEDLGAGDHVLRLSLPPLGLVILERDST